MFRSALPYAQAAGIEEPLVCYQGAAVVDPRSGEFLLHEPIPLDLAREAIAAVQAEGFGLNCYVDDELYVAEITQNARAYADFQHIPITEVGDLLAWLERPPTKLVVVDAPDDLDALRPTLTARFGDRLFIAKSLPVLPRAREPARLEGQRDGLPRGAPGLHGRADGRVRRRRERPRAAASGRATGSASRTATRS